MIQMINTQKLASLITDNLSHEELISRLKEIFDGLGTEIVHIERTIGDLPVAVNGGGDGGTSNHALLSNLSYASAGHTGFAQSSHTHTGYEPAIAAGTASKFFSWDKTWRDVDWSHIANKPSFASSGFLLATTYNGSATDGILLCTQYSVT